jgi:hypothetical protein
MSLDSVITGTRHAVTDNPALAHVVLAAQGTVVAGTEVAVRTGRTLSRRTSRPEVRVNVSVTGLRKMALLN